MYVTLAAGALLGAAAQRLTGVGYTLVAGPLFIAAIGPWDALALFQLCGLLLTCAIIVQTWSWIDWALVRDTVPWIVLAGVPTLCLAGLVPARVLSWSVAAAILGSVAIVVLRPTVRLPDSRPRRAAVAAMSGLMGAGTGVGGPPLALYAQATRMPVAVFVASAQVPFAILALSVLTTRWLVFGSAVPLLGVSVYAVVGIATAVGIGCGRALAGTVPDRLAFHLLNLISVLGAVTILVRPA